jgi:hypothetical protein
MFLGIAAIVQNNGSIDTAFVAHDGTYSIDFAVYTVENQTQSHSLLEKSVNTSGTTTPAGGIRPEELSYMVADYFVNKIRAYAKEHHYKFVGLGMTTRLQKLSPELPARLWSELDIVPMIFDKSIEKFKTRKGVIMVDGEADSMARKCLR